ncbi:MAG TPA: hypothetical protein VGM83_08540 [Devosiaceae bacterium]|jgi:hypothetical protein
MPKSQNTRLVSWIDCPGGGQVWVDGTTLFVGHMDSPAGTSIYDVADPAHPQLLTRLEMPRGWHSHKVRAKDNIMIVNHERQKSDAVADFSGGLGIYDISQPAAPKLLKKWEVSGGSGVHRFDYDGRYAFISPTAEGFVGNIVVILDLIDPANPVEIGRWWIPGQNVGAGEVYPWAEDWPKPRCHHPLRQGDRLYVSYWHHGFFILDISDKTNPRLVSGYNTSPSQPHPTHTCLVMPELMAGRKIMVVADEDMSKLRPSPPSFAWVYDITDEEQPISIGTINVPELMLDPTPRPETTGCHQPSEVFTQPILPFAWFSHGLRIMNISNPFRSEQVGYYQPDAPEGFATACANDVTQDSRGLIYMTDRNRGVHIIERV